MTVHFRACWSGELPTIQIVLFAEAALGITEVIGTRLRIVYRRALEKRWTKR